MLSSIQPSPSRAIALPRRPRRVAVSASVVDVPLVVGGAAAVVGLGSLYLFTDPQKRREQQMQQTGGNEKESVRDYFNGEGFDRWKRIYGTVEDVNDVQRDIRDGHGVTIRKVIDWMTEDKGKKERKWVHRLTESMSGWWPEFKGERWLRSGSTHESLKDGRPTIFWSL